MPHGTQIEKILKEEFRKTGWMPNTADKISSQTAAEIKRLEDYLNSLRKLQIALNPPPKKRKCTKRKKVVAPNPALKRPEVPIYQFRENFIPGQIYTTNYEITGIKNTKKNRSRKKVV